VGIIGTARKRGKHFNLLRPFLLCFKAVRWLHHFRKPVVKVVDGIRYELDLNQNIDTSIYFLGAFEPDAVAAMKKFIRPGDVVLDVGANVGCHALLLSKLVGLHDRVIAFEPTDWAFRKPARNKELNLDLCTQNMALKKSLSLTIPEDPNPSNFIVAGVSSVHRHNLISRWWTSLLSMNTWRHQR
jgi:hypothetical protein